MPSTSHPLHFPSCLACCLLFFHKSAMQNKLKRSNERGKNPRYKACCFLVLFINNVSSTRHCDRSVVHFPTLLMAPRHHTYIVAVLEALSAHAELAQKPRSRFSGRVQSFNRRFVHGSARGQPEHGSFEALLQKGKPHIYLERKRPAIHQYGRIDRALSQSEICVNPLPHQQSFIYPCSSLPQDMHVWMLRRSCGTRQTRIHVRPMSSILQHGPVQASTDDEKQEVSKKKPLVVVVLLGWLGAKHRHLKKYADWYTLQGMHAITFTIPLKDFLTLRPEKHVEILCHKLLEWLREDESSQSKEKHVIFHTFSNTGWMTYGALLERLLKSNEGVELMKRVKGCVVDSGPAPQNDPRVWAAGLCAALLKKSSVATQMQLEHAHTRPTMKETAVIALFEKLLAGFLRIPYVKRRIDDIVLVLSSKQLTCPQLYLYSNADTVIPAVLVESFIAEQRKAGCIVYACNFQTSPHVDHFRSFPLKYRKQLASFLEGCLPQSVGIVGV